MKRCPGDTQTVRVSPDRIERALREFLHRIQDKSECRSESPVRPIMRTVAMMRMASWHRLLQRYSCVSTVKVKNIHVGLCRRSIEVVVSVHRIVGIAA